MRAGFIDAPVSAPPIRMSKAIVRPIPKPPIFGALGSTAVPKTANTRKKVTIASTKMPVIGVTPGASIGVPSCAFLQMLSAKIALRKKPAIVAPTSCDTM